MDKKAYNYKDNVSDENVTLSFDFYEGQSIGETGLILAIVLTCDNEYKEPFGTPTVSFGEFIGQEFCSYMDTNNWPEIEKFLEENNIATKTPFKKRSGFCEYPLYMINPELVAEKLDENELKEYLDCFDFYGTLKGDYEGEVEKAAEVYKNLAKENAKTFEENQHDEHDYDLY